ncbi:extracellular solute-binding protein [Fundicoccus culcitae]|uniref:Extracellular solute-binding protein n=1 Tax=Fundicoccus culcitae TaxID=2969821 RepID=A0ABY5P8Q5_9LACT|nr:extracellular solute-binding protein [Fundicoccus culcitae]UUX35139.1 extracellular solute-binding protein [Fundicoccus culcitae]
MLRNLSKIFAASLLSVNLLGVVANVQAQEPIVINMGRQTSTNPKLPDGDTYEDNAYTRLVNERLNVQIQSAFEANGEDYERQVSLAIASGELPDMMIVGDRDVVQELYENELIADLTDIYEEYASDYIKEIYSSYDDSILNAISFDDRMYALSGTSVDLGPSMFWLRQDWLDELGLDIDPDGDRVISLSQLVEVARAFMEADLGETGRPVGIPFNYWLTSSTAGGSTFAATGIANSFGAYPKEFLLDDNNQLYYGSNTPEMKQTLEFLRDLFNEGIIDPQFGTRTNDDITAMIINEETGIVAGPWHIPDWNLIQTRQSNSNAVFVPYAIESQSEEGHVSSISNKGPNQYVVVRSDYEHPELAIQIINLIYDEIPNSMNINEEFPTIAEYLNTGVDGTARPFNMEVLHAEYLLEEGRATALGALDEIPVEELPSIEAIQNVGLIKSYYEDPSNSEPVEWAKYASRVEAIDNLMNSLRDSNSLTEIFPPRFYDIKAMERNGAQLDKLQEETFIKFITGEESLDNFDSYVETWHNQGGTDVLAEMQADIDNN